jgi:glycosyltransferase 2 family protein
MRNTFEVIRNNKWKIIISFIVAIFIILAITFVIGFNNVLNVLKQANLIYVLIVFILEFIILIIWTLRWRLILNVVDESPGFKNLFLMLFASLFGNNITPGAAGGEPLRAYLLKKIEGTPFEIGFASSIADRVFEFFPFVLISLFAAYLILTWNISFYAKIILSVVIILTLIFFVVLLYAGINKEIFQRIIISSARRIYPIFRRISENPMTFSEVTEKLIYYINRFSSGFLEVLADQRTFIIGFLLSLGMWGLDMIRLYVCFVALDFYPPVFPLILIYTIAILISLLPTLPGTLGIREATLVGLFAVVGVPADVVIAASIIDRLASYVLPTFIGGFVAFYFANKLKNEGLDSGYSKTSY